MNKPLITVVMPAYNAQKYISSSIESVIAQTFHFWELIIVDDGSTDNTAEIIKRYQEEDARIKYFYQENARQGKAKNTAIQNSTGDYIAFLDADDLWLVDKLEKSLNEIMKGDYALLFTDCYVFEDFIPGNLSDLRRLGVESDVFYGRDSLLLFLNYNRIPNLTVLVKKEALLTAGEFTDSVVAEEYDMWLRLLKNGGVFKSIPEPLSLYRIHNESITAPDRHATFEVIKIVKAFGEKNPEYKEDVLEIAKEKIKYWLYNGSNRTTKKFRILIKGIYSHPQAALFYGLSFLMPVDQLRKIVRRLC